MAPGTFIQLVSSFVVDDVGTWWPLELLKG